jgi:hypothetical protein
VVLRDGGKNFNYLILARLLNIPRWIFILEGILTVIVAFIAFFTLHDFPETATFLTEEERAFIVYRLKYQGHNSGDEVKVAQDDTFQWKYVKAAFLDWQIWTNIWVYWGIVSVAYLDSDIYRADTPRLPPFTVSRFSCLPSSVLWDTQAPQRSF